LTIYDKAQKADLEPGELDQLLDDMALPDEESPSAENLA